LKEYCKYTDQQAWIIKEEPFKMKIRMLIFWKAKTLQGQKKAERT